MLSYILHTLQQHVLAEKCVGANPASLHSRKHLVHYKKNKHYKPLVTFYLEMGLNCKD